MSATNPLADAQPQNSRQCQLLSCEILEDRITPTISFGNVSGGETEGSNCLSVATGDLTGNGRQDTVISTFTGGIEIFMNNGDGSFKETKAFKLDVTANIIKLADMTGNGKLDLVVGSTGSDEIIICMGNGNGTFQTQHPIVKTLNYNVQDLTVGDLNGDGLPDVVAAIPGGAAVLLNNGTSHILGSPTYYNPSNQPDQAFVAIGDFNGDGKPDIAISVYSQNLVDIYPNKGDGAFGSPTPYDDPIDASPGHLLTGDFNNDGKIDLVVSYVGSSDVGLLEGNGDGTFQNAKVIDTGVTSSNLAAPIAAADFDDDGNLDLVYPNEEYYQTVVLPGNGNGTFGVPINVNSAADVSGIAIADVDGDGLPDIIAIGATSGGTYSVALNTSVPNSVSARDSTVAFASDQLASGKSTLVTIDAKDAVGNPLRNLSEGDFQFSFSAGESNGTLSDFKSTSKPGVYTFLFSAVTAGTASTLELNINGFPIVDQPLIEVSPGSFSRSTSSISLSSSTDASGTVDTVTITLEDANGNFVTDISSKALKLSIAGGSSTGKLSKVMETATPGVFSAYFTGAIAGTAKTLHLKVKGVPIVSNPKLQVTPGAPSPDKTSIRAASAIATTGKDDQITITVRDAAGNAVENLSSDDFIISYTGGTSTATIGTVTETSKPWVYTVAFTGLTLGSASAVTVSIDGVLIEDQPKIKVNA